MDKTWRVAVCAAVALVCCVQGCGKRYLLFPYAIAPTTADSQGASMAPDPKSLGAVVINHPRFWIAAARGTAGGRTIVVMNLELTVQNLGKSPLVLDLPNARLSCLDDPFFSKPIVKAVAAPMTGEGFSADVVTLNPGETQIIYLRFREEIRDLVNLDFSLKGDEGATVFGLRLSYRVE